MSETKWIEGPYKCEPTPKANDIRILSQSGELIATVYARGQVDHPQRYSPERTLAQGQIFASVWRLYDALAELTDEAIANNLDPHFVRIAREALAKARGEA